MDLCAIVLAAGQGTRMKSALPKVLHPVSGRPMVWYPTSLARQLTKGAIVLVVGHASNQVRAYLEQHKSDWDPLLIVEQAQQLGTGHAVQQAYSCLKEHLPHLSGHCLIMNGDTPLLTSETLEAFIAHHETQRATLTLLTTHLQDPSGYGRVIRREDGFVVRIVEDRDATPQEKEVSEINVGTYIVKEEFLGKALAGLQPQNAQGEYYLTDIIEMAVDEGHSVSGWVTADPLETTGINTRVQLAVAEKEMQARICQRHLLAGVTMKDPSRVIIESGVQIDQDATLYPGVILEGNTRVGKGCTIRENSRLTNTVLGQGVLIQDSCVLQDSEIGDEGVIGPFAHVRPGSRTHRKAKIGNFVELKQSEIGEGSKVNHLSYIGDAIVGRHVNIGAGTITCNYDGYRKEKTIIGDNVFIGSDVQLVAPVTVGEGALVAAGTTVTENVPPNALGISRVAQMNKEGTAARRRALLDSQKNRRNTSS